MQDTSPMGGGVSGNVCPVCHAPILPDSQAIFCTKCGVQHHAQCWQTNHGCGAPNCAMQSSAAPAQPMQPTSIAQTGRPMQPQSRTQAQQQSCPRCGYVLGPFDTSCPKCARATVAGGTQQPPPGTQPGYGPQQPYGPSSYPPQYGKQPFAACYNIAGFGIRFAAMLLDGIILGIFAIPAMMSMFRNMAVIASQSGPSFNQAAASQTMLHVQSLMMLLNAGFALYEICMVGFLGATLGKMACKIKVVRTDGSDIGFARGLLRYILKSVLGGMCGLTYWFILFHPERRALHDIILGTNVMKRQ